MYNAVGIDASKLKSTITIIQPAGVVIRKPFDVLCRNPPLFRAEALLQFIH